MNESASWVEQKRYVTVDGLYFIQEDSPQAIATALDAWLADLPAQGA